jgi:hypothetical protein
MVFLFPRNSTFYIQQEQIDGDGREKNMLRRKSLVLFVWIRALVLELLLRGLNKLTQKRIRIRIRQMVLSRLTRECYCFTCLSVIKVKI